jgi:quinoprotein glucose dehydrogenase
MGDRGLSVGNFHLPDTGAVLRCNPDGSELEVYATGLRNPEQLAFDAAGNLWTGDNNSDAGDQARWVWVVEDGDTGWNFGFQQIILKSPWMTERLWAIEAGQTAPSLVPPVGYIGHGPAGIAFYGGTGLSAAYDDHFFMADFPGGIRSFAVKPKGAGYELVDEKEFLWELWPTDVEVGPDGAVYVSDWVQGWAKPEKSRIYRITDPVLIKDPVVLETKRILAEGMEKRSLEELSGLLGHRNQRVRQAAQFELVARRAEAPLSRVAGSGQGLARLHALWGLGQLGRTAPVRGFLGDPDPEVRAQSAKVLGDRRDPAALEGLVRALKDESLRVRLFASIALGRLGRKEAVGPLLELLRENADRDPFVRHGGVSALARIGEVEPILKERSLDALLVLRRLGRPEVAAYLDQPETALEAARAIYDVPIEAALPALAARISDPHCPSSILLRVLNANFRLGHARELGTFLAREEAPEGMRSEVLQMFADWEHPSGRDRLMGCWRPLQARDPGPARLALAPLVEKLLTSRLKTDTLRAVTALRDPRASGLLEAALEDRDEAVRREAVRLIVRSAIPGKASLLARLSGEKNPPGVRQQAIASMGDVEGTDGTLEAILDQLLEGSLPVALHLDVLEAAGKRPGEAIRSRLARFETARKKDDPLAPWREVLEGGDPKAGRVIFFERLDVACMRCHTVKDRGGVVGPPLTRIGAEKTREYLLESILFPNKVIAQGYGQETFALRNDDVVSGRIEKETEAEVKLVLPDGERRTLPKTEIRARKPALSAMPEDIAKPLSKRDLRDLVAFLADLKR